MKPKVVILSGDALFARMLFLEFSMRNLSVEVAASTESIGAEEVVLVDLDSAVPPKLGNDAYVIGFTRQAALSGLDPDRRCSMILHRPFEISLLCREVLSHVLPERAEESRERETTAPTLSVVGDRLCFGERSVALSPRERSILNCLLTAEGAVVSREALSDLVGESSANKIDVYVCYLRRKIASLTDKNLLRTARGKGYFLTNP